MPRSFSSPRKPSLAMPMLVGLLVVLPLLPARWIGFLGWFSGVAQTLLAPLEQPVAASVRWLRGPARVEIDADPRIRELTAELERSRLLRLQAEDQARTLRDQLVKLQRGIDLTPSLDVRQFFAPVINLQPDPSGTLLKIRAGTNQGVSTDAVAVFDDVHLIGRVRSADALISYVMPITDRGAGVLDAVVITDEYAGTAPAPPAGEMIPGALRCSLTPTGDGRLSGPVAYQALRPGMVNPEVKVGQVVRLVGEPWPQAAKYLVVGIVERVELAPNQRPMITVKPVYELRSVGSVIVRFTDPSAGRGGGGGGGG